MKVQTYINEGPGMFWKYEPGDKLTPGPVVEIASRPDGPSATLLDRELAVAETVWMIGNRMGVDANGNAWPAGVRSMSVADVIVIGETAYKCAHVGWEPISTEDLAWSLDPERQNRNLRLEESRA